MSETSPNIVLNDYRIDKVEEVLELHSAALVRVEKSLGQVKSEIRVAENSRANRIATWRWFVGTAIAAAAVAQTAVLYLLQVS